MSGRRSYRGLMQQPVWYLLGKGGRVTASIRAPTKEEARRLFDKHGLMGRKIVSRATYDFFANVR